MTDLGRIYLVGMPGSGKTYFGKQLIEEQELNASLVDLDEAIELKEGRTISEIFEKNGEDYFRQVEHDLLKNLTEQDANLLLSTGGGTPCFHQGMDYMKKHGTVVYLTASEETLAERLSANSHRPLIQGEVISKIKNLLEQRAHIYQKAHMSMDHRDTNRFMTEFLKIKS